MLSILNIIQNLQPTTQNYKQLNRHTEHQLPSVNGKINCTIFSLFGCTYDPIKEPNSHQLNK